MYVWCVWHRQNDSRRERESTRTDWERDRHENVQETTTNTEKHVEYFDFNFVFSFASPTGEQKYNFYERKSDDNRSHWNTNSKWTSMHAQTGLRADFYFVSFMVRASGERDSEARTYECSLLVCACGVDVYRQFVVMAGAEWVEFQYSASCQSFLRPSTRSISANAEIVFAIKCLSEYYLKNSSVTRVRTKYKTQFR